MNKKIHDIHKELEGFLAEINEDNSRVWYMFTQDLEAWLTILDGFVKETNDSNVEEIFDDILYLFDYEQFEFGDNKIEIPKEYIEKWYKLLG